MNSYSGASIQDTCRCTGSYMNVESFKSNRKPIINFFTDRVATSTFSSFDKASIQRTLRVLHNLQESIVLGSLA